MKLSEIALSAVAHHKYQLLFNKESWNIKEMYWSNLRKFESGSIYKIFISLDNLTVDDKISNQHVNVLIIDKQFNFDYYFSCDIYNRKIILLNTIHNGVMKIAEQQNWNTNPFLDSYNNCLARNLDNWFFGKYYRSPDRCHYAQLIYHWDIDKFEAFIAFTGKDKKEIRRVKFIETEPHLGVFIYYVNLKWIDVRVFSIATKKENIEVSIC